MLLRTLPVIGLLYTVQFIPAIFAFMTLPIILRQEGYSATTIGLLQLVGMPHVLKFLWAPLIDKYKIGRDRYKSWIMALSAIHVTTLIVLSFVEPSGPIVLVFIVLFIAMAAVSTQDIAVDALAISLVEPRERGWLATFQSLGIYVGAVVGGFGFLYIYGKIGWTAALLIQATIFTLPLFALTFLVEPERPQDAPPVTFRAAMRFFRQPHIGRWLAVLATIRLPLVIISLPIRLLMVDEGMTTEEIAFWFGLVAMCSAGGASALFGPLMRNLPRIFAIYLVGTVNIIALIAIYLAANALPDTVRYTIVAVWTVMAITDVVMFQGAMDKVRPEIPGFDFSIQMVVLTMIPMLASPLVGVVMDTYGHQPIFSATVFLAFVPMAILYIWIAPLHKSDVGLDGENVLSTAQLKSQKTTEILKTCEAIFSEEGINCTRPEPNFLLMEQMGCRVEIKATDGEVDIRIETPTDNFMTFIRDSIVEQLEKVDPKAVAEMSWAGDIRVGERPANFRILRAVRREQVFPGLIRVTLAGQDVQALTRDGIHLKVMMPEQRGRVPVWPVTSENGGISWPQGEDQLHTRFLTIKEIRVDCQEIDVDIAHHDSGLISNWASLDGDNQEVGVMGPGGDLSLPGTDNVVLAADYTGLPAVARLIEISEGKVTGHLFVAGPSREVVEGYLPTSNLKVTVIEAKAFAHNVVELTQNCTDEPVSYAWFAGEFKTAQAMRSIFKGQFGLDKTSQHSVAYWREGVPGHH